MATHPSQQAIEAANETMAAKQAAAKQFFSWLFLVLFKLTLSVDDSAGLRHLQRSIL